MKIIHLVKKSIYISFIFASYNCIFVVLKIIARYDSDYYPNHKNQIKFQLTCYPKISFFIYFHFCVFYVFLVKKYMCLKLQ